MSTDRLPVVDPTQSNQVQRSTAEEFVQETFGEDEGEVLDPEKILKQHEACHPGPEHHYHCMTEAHPSLRILIGHGGEIPRWEYGSTINFAAEANGYPQQGDAEFAACHLWQAAEQWNSYDLGVRFQWVGKRKQATFILKYVDVGPKESTMAKSFFPTSRPQNTLFVYKKGLVKHRKTLKNTFLHELGHILGLRHEFALDREHGAVIFGLRNPKSVMSYEFPQEVQDSDIDGTRRFYEYRKPSIQGLTITDYIPNQSMK
ncbi:peptidase M12B family protein [Metarhizium robertsii]|uniref:Metallopeptidase, catalytic domain protein n=2 Tax=Metarhizium robertsii TaxID=568076 RepID=E9FE69_METRA|nr:Metallopeptidase, catalytic domain protein [Metarhizium robertsii ARSEF 23]EFY93970.1 Metallopeptidase, catalytic domain protein [Metarhizium robertsii ARSEF 23]EXU97348.1 peptidase M12B family protein [Metarhizium robertsii]